MKTISRYIMTLALLITAVGGAWAADTYTITFSGFGNEACNKTVTDAALEYSETFFVNDVDADYIALNDVGGSNEYVSISQAETQITITVKSAFEGTEKVTVYYVNGEGDEAERKISVTCVKNAPAIEVTTNAASEQDLFTEASFQMPAFDATAEYELVRDMSIQMTATMGDGTDGVRYRVKKAQQGQGYEPADMNMMQVLALVAVNDGIEHKDLTLDQDYFCRIYKLDEQTLQPEGDGVKLTDFDFAPGLYALKAFAKDDSDYAGETALSNTFKLFQGYEVEVPAGEYVTYYKDEALKVEDADAKLYTITAVNETAATATLSDAMTVTPANTPLLVYNSSEDTKTFLLIPTTDEADNVTAADEFKGTLEATQIAASTTTQNNYAFNGKAFVWVKNDIAISANKAWLEIGSGAAGARSVVLVFSDSLTGVNLTPALSEGEGAWYDLSGRKLQGKPTKSGVYINNGKKVTIK